MSMISSNCDDLRNAADELQNVIDNAHNYTWPGIVSILHYAQQGLRDAADTIWELRCKLVDQRKEIERLKREKACLRSCLSDDAENARQIMGESAKLRELARDLRFCARQSNCLKCEYGRICNLRLDERCKEFGIEV